MSRRTTKAVSAVVIGLLVVLTWWLQAGGETDQAEDRPTATASAGATTSSEDPAVPSDTGRMPDRDEHGIHYVALEDLPLEAADMVVLIEEGGPFPYPDKDGSNFGNFEGILPERPPGYYAEYTVETPGLSHRGARRIVAGDEGELYWTEDHYESFERIRR